MCQVNRREMSQHMPGGDFLECFSLGEKIYPVTVRDTFPGLRLETVYKGELF